MTGRMGRLLFVCSGVSVIEGYIIRAWAVDWKSISVGGVLAVWVAVDFQQHALHPTRRSSSSSLCLHVFTMHAYLKSRVRKKTRHNLMHLQWPLFQLCCSKTQVGLFPWTTCSQRRCDSWLRCMSVTEALGEVPPFHCNVKQGDGEIESA
ncbi:hypothetical protein IWZ03DRAFT_175533 [Phyllosticta citriasiana]|uniref:Secreted protein n=1 Tax=Phyllosticta citriasiana TaxID=595635 RepID=A0ABR1KNV1_9PEZI